jgi:two-component system nitrate/nitrite response regulator NarL
MMIPHPEFVGEIPQSRPARARLSDPVVSEGVIAVALIEDNRLVREGITALLNRLPDIQVVASDAGALEWINGNLNQTPPQVILLDIGLDVRDSLKVAKDLRQEFPSAKIVVMDLLPAHEDVIEFISTGVSGFIMKDATLDDVCNTIRSVAAGNDVLPKALTATLFSEIAKEAVAAGGASVFDNEGVRLTSREQEVINLVAEGLSNKAIGHSLHVSIHTVKSHLRNIMEKLTLHSRLQIASFVHNQKNDKP